MIYLTRSQPGAQKSARYLEQNGFYSVALYPLLRLQIQPICTPTINADNIVFTSGNAVRALAAQGVVPGTQTVWCVGQATAEVARLHGWCNVRTSEGNARDLGHFILSHIDADARKTGMPKRCFIHFANTAASSALVEMLIAKDYNAKKIDVYSMAPQNVGPLLTAIVKSPPDAPKIVVFHSKAAAKNFAEALPLPAGASTLLKAVAYSDEIASVLNQHSIPVVVLRRPNDTCLLLTLKTILSADAR